MTDWLEEADMIRHCMALGRRFLGFLVVIAVVATVAGALAYRYLALRFFPKPDASTA